MLAEMELDHASPHWKHTLRYIQRYAMRLVDASLAYRFDYDDLTQDVMLILMSPKRLARLQTIMGGIDPGVSQQRVFIKYVNIVIRRKLKDRIRSAARDRKHRDQRLPEGEDEDERAESVDPLDTLASAAPSTERYAELREELAEVYQGLRTLNSRNRATARKVSRLWQSILTGDEYQHIAEQFACDPDSVRVDICRIRHELRQALGRPKPKRSAGAQRKPDTRAEPDAATQHTAKARRKRDTGGTLLRQSLQPLMQATPSQALANPRAAEADGFRADISESAGAQPSPEPAPAKERKGRK